MISAARGLRTGYTTGACAAAATKASLSMLLCSIFNNNVSIALPGGEIAIFAATLLSHSGTKAVTCVKKDGGDDPDVTSGLSICSEVSLRPDLQDGTVLFLHGEGVGTVTLAGLGIPLGDPAINPVPRTMITGVVRTLLDRYGVSGGASVRISVPGGAALAEKTMNARLGVLGGISIIGTSGIVVPYSGQAYLDSIRRALQVAAENGCRELAISAGARSENALRSVFPGLPEQAFIHYGNRIGKTLEMIGDIGGFERVVVGVMLAKSTKLAQGELDLSSRSVGLDREFIAGLAAKTGYPESTGESIMERELVRSVVELIPFRAHEPFYRELAEACRSTCASVIPSIGLTFVLISQEHGCIVCPDNR